MPTTADLSLQLTLKSRQISEFFPLLQRGIWLPATTGCSVIKLLSNQLGIAEDYVADRITTLFLDGKAIDDAAASFVKDGSTLALSSAMPGLVGSTMRRGGHLAAMRGEITYHQTKVLTVGAGKVKIKLFNMLMKEVGPLLLERGFIISGAELVTLLTEGEASFQDGCVSVSVNDRPYSCDELGGKLLTILSPQQTILLKIIWKD